MYWQNRSKAILAAILVLALGAFAVFALREEKAPQQAVFTSIGGQKVTLQDLRGKVVVVNFWATSCPGCVAEMPQMIETQNKYGPQGLQTIAVAMSYDPPSYVSAYSEKNHLPFFVTLDSDGQLARAFRDVRLTPTTFVLDKQGNILQRTIGVPDFAKLHSLIERALQT
jgi:peroxiredoxin